MNVLRMVLQWALPGKMLSPRKRQEMTDEEVRGALARIEAGDPRMRALLEMALDRAAAMNQSALAASLDHDRRLWYAGGASALVQLVTEVLSQSDREE